MATVLSSSPDARGAADPASYCKDLVQKYDYESFLTAPFYPREMQKGYFALKAFYVSPSAVLSVSMNRLIWAMEIEVAIIQDNVSNSTLGKMRMQFWRDAVKQISQVWSLTQCSSRHD